jgi:carbonic anhydrase
MSDLDSLRPRGVWERFLAANLRHAEGRPRHPRQEAGHRRGLLEGQAPHAAILSCSDSRIVPEIIFDQGLGDLFVIRVAGNVLGQVVLASVEYAVGHLKVPLVIVLGHSSCGAVTATLSGTVPEGHLSALTEKITATLGSPAAPPPASRPLTGASSAGAPPTGASSAGASTAPGSSPAPAGGAQVSAARIDAAAQTHAIAVARELRASMPIIGPRVRSGATEIVAAYYDRESGRVRELADGSPAAP